MSSIKKVSVIDITSSLPLNCSSASSAWTGSGHDTFDTSYVCHGTPAGLEAYRLRMGLGLGLGLGIPVVASIIYACYRFEMYQRLQIAMDKLLPAYEMEVLPAYSPQADEGSQAYLEGASNFESVSNLEREQREEVSDGGEAGGLQADREAHVTPGDDELPAYSPPIVEGSEAHLETVSHFERERREAASVGQEA